MAWLFATFCFVVPLPSLSFQQTKRQKTTKKSHDRFVDWATRSQDQNNDRLLLLVDGNNVRGIGKFEWNAIELQHRIARFCHKYQVPNAVVVWDHGSDKFACSRQYCFDGMGEEVVASLANINDNSSDHDIFCVKLVTLFSGIRQRADDVIVKESNHIIASSSVQNDGGSKTKINWSSMAFVTNDSELNYKLRRQAAPNPSSIRLSRRKRRDIGKKHECDNQGTDTPAEGTSSSRKDTSVPMFCDSTGFVDLLSQISLEYNMTMDFVDQEASDLINEAKHCIRECSKSQRRGYNPRREKTWERCVQAETLRRFLCKHATADGNPPPMQEDSNAVFVADYLKELQTERDYSTPLKGRTLADHKGNHDSLRGMFMPFLGPSRLDKQQRRQLDRYNALAKKGEI
eukprot:CAMPEP_0172373082 /NCGR_PEP_ID=MMETSP1060-20121228/50260_1 /TAXON_ID=37318 /ORGANISM="Pseudo-nitzschia pungens, Strain cf. cingulata" /LENGTH=400 /DNA_ID=CAMNT_0013099293 /DNA_START=224 /DNA_END=1426 /DNA_ORIENTATION=+